MRYDDIEAHKSIINDNIEITNNLDEITKRLEKLDLKYINFKVIGISGLVGLLLGSSIATAILLMNNTTTDNNIPIPLTTIENPINEDYKQELDYANNLIVKLKKIIKQNIQTEKNNKKIIKKLRSKILPSEYYCTLENGKRGICGYFEDENGRYITLIDNDEGCFIELK